MSRWRRLGAAGLAACVLLGVVACSSPTIPRSGADRSRNSTTPIVDPHSGWVTCDDAAVGVSFEYPPTWTKYFQGCNDTDVVLASPHQDRSGLYFRLEFSQPASGSSLLAITNQGEGVIRVVQQLAVQSSPRPVYLVGFGDRSDGPTGIDHMVLANTKYTVGEEVSGVSNTFDAQVGSKAAASCLIDLRPPNADPEYSYGFRLSTWTSVPSYSELVQILGTLQLRLPLQL